MSSEPRCSQRSETLSYSPDQRLRRNDFLNSVKTNYSSYHSLDQESAPETQTKQAQSKFAIDSIQSASDSFKSLNNI